MSLIQTQATKIRENRAGGLTKKIIIKEKKQVCDTVCLCLSVCLSVSLSLSGSKKDRLTLPHLTWPWDLASFNQSARAST